MVFVPAPSKRARGHVGGMVHDAGIKDAHPEKDPSQAQDVAVVQLVGQEAVVAAGLVERIRQEAPADQLAVEKGAVTAAQVADADARRFDVEQAVVPGDARQVAAREANLAILGPPYEIPAAIL